MPGTLRGLYRPVIALGAVQLAEEQVVLLGALGEPAERVVGRIEPVVDEHLAPVSACVVAREKDGMGRGRGSGFQVAVDRLNHGDSGRVAPQREVGVQDLGVPRQARRDAGGVGELARRHLDHGRFGDARAGRGEQGHPVAERREPPHQRDDHTLGTSVAFGGKRLVRGDHDPHQEDSVLRDAEHVVHVPPHQIRRRDELAQ